MKFFISRAFARTMSLYIVLFSFASVAAHAEGPKNCVNTLDPPWVVSNGCGESWVTDIFYADPIQNEQVMPVKIQDQWVKKAGLPAREQIDALIYPTIGNPNLYVQEDARDFLRVVLRMEWAKLAPAGAEAANSGARIPQNEAKSSQPKFLVNFDAAAAAKGAGVKFFLANRANRAALVKPLKFQADPAKGVFEIKPSRFAQHGQNGYPKLLQSRHTLEIDFDQAAMKGVKPGFYDLRMEITDGQKVTSYEYQYNSVRVFASESDTYTVVNVTDSQVSVSRFGENLVGRSFAKETQDKLASFVKYIAKVMNARKAADGSAEAKIQQAAFITFNGDLHNGGAASPTDLMPKAVADNYRREAERILDIIMDLELPIFLTAGNHDGYVAMGHAPLAIRAAARLTGEMTVEQVVKEAAANTGRPDLTARFLAFLEATKDDLGGHKVDVTVGNYIRHDSQGWTKSVAPLLPTYKGQAPHFVSDRAAAVEVNAFEEIPAAQKNLPLYDGFHQWRKTYGPLYTSWRFGKNMYLNLNSYDCHQHRRAGWGMYTVNYGGCVSGPQMLWLNTQKEMSKEMQLDMVLIAHHDPRGGHNGKAYPFYFEQIDYTGALVSLKNYVVGEIINPKLCPMLSSLDSDAAVTNAKQTDCYNDGLQEWMLPDDDFGCKDEEKVVVTGTGGKPALGMCNHKLFSDDLPEGIRRNHRYTGYELIHHITTTWGLRTLLLGHTHYNTVEVLTPGTNVVPDEVVLSSDNHKKYAQIFTANEASLPMRLFSRVWKKLKKNADGELDDEEMKKVIQQYKDVGVEQKNLKNLEVTKLLFGPGSKHTFEHKISKEKEIAIIRTVSISSMTSQSLAADGSSAFGFAVFEVTANSNRHGYPVPTLSEITFLHTAGTDASFVPVGEVMAIDRAADRPYTQMQGQDPFKYSK